ncbi:MAG: hypothetical protein P1U68_05405 [Verrucomicrobiales bacterium]|nr:hypothetical protein [Verrucomicrobiales bacterium]
MERLLKYCFLKIKLIAILFLTGTAAFGKPTEVKSWTDAFAELSTQDAIRFALDNAENWPGITEVVPGAEEQSDDDVRFVVQVLKSLEMAIGEIEINPAQEWLDSFEDFLEFSNLASNEEGYLNELIAATCDQVAVAVAWRVIAADPSAASDIARALKSYQGIPSAKQWFLKNVDVDKSIKEFEVNIQKAADDIPGDQLANWIMLNNRKEENEVATVYSMMQKPDLLTLWRQMLANDFQLSATIPAAVAYIGKGGKLVPAPDDIPGAIKDVFGESGIPFRHDSRSGLLYSGDIWMSLNLYVDDAKLQIQRRSWFGD